MTQLSPHFTLQEFTRSLKAINLGIDNKKTTEQQRHNMALLCAHVLEPLRAAVRAKIDPYAVVVITSGFRSPALNFAVKGDKHSQHLRGQAADIHVADSITGERLLTAEQLFNFIKAEDIAYDQLLQEYDSWVHVSYNPLRGQKQRRSALYVWKNRLGRVVYTAKRPKFGYNQNLPPIT